MKKLDPRVKLFTIILVTSLALVFKNMRWMAVLTLCVLILSAVMGADLKAFFRRFAKFAPLLLMIILVQIVFVRTGPPIWITDSGFLLVSEDGLMRGAATALRLFIILCSASIMAGENSRRVIAGMTKMGLPYMFSFMLMTALRFIPMFSTAFSDAMTSIRLRGIEPKEVKPGRRISLYGHLLLPVVADAVVKSQDLATAMEARGFGAYKKRTSFIEVKMGAADWLALALLAAAGAAAFILYFK